jgi:hypothetical protein
VDILFLTSSEINYQEDILHEGFDELLGPEHVFCYPYKDYRQFQYNLYEESKEDPGHRQPVSLAEILTDPRRFDAVIVGSVRPDTVGLWRQIHTRFPHCPVAALHGEEAVGWPPHLWTTHRFQMQMYETDRTPGLFPLPLAVPPRAMMPAEIERDIAVSFVVRPTVEIRGWCGELLRALGHTSLVGVDVPREQFCWILNRSLIAISLRGAAWDTFRYWEIPYHGALLLSERLPILLPENFVDGESAVFFHGAKDMLAKIDSLLSDRERLAGIAARGRDLAWAKHTATARAAYVLDKMGLTPYLPPQTEKLSEDG